MAALIGWIRSMTLELRALPRGKAAFAPPIARQIAAFKSALADGPDVELDRLDRLATLWGFDLSRLGDGRKAALATRFEVEAHAATEGRLKFAELLQSDAPWFAVLARSIDDIDFDEADPSDFRARQLRALSDAAASILAAVADTEDAALVDDASLAAARRLRATLGSV